MSYLVLNGLKVGGKKTAVLHISKKRMKKTTNVQNSIGLKCKSPLQAALKKYGCLKWPPYSSAHLPFCCSFIQNDIQMFPLRFLCYKSG